MAEKIINLSGRALDVLYALFFRGALQSRDLPSKSGAAQLRELGLAETRHTATAHGKVNHFTFLTAEGQEFAIENLVKTRFGVPVGGYIGETSGKLYSAGIGINIEGDRFKVVNEAAQSAINNAVVCSGKITVKAVLSDEMKQAVIDAVRESDLFTSLQAAIAAQATSTVDLQQAVDDTVGKALRNAVKPGGMIWSSFQLCQH